MLEQIFRPRWRHGDAEIRRRAVADLHPDNPKQRNALQQLAWSDPSPEVRMAAIGRLTDLPLLTSLRGEGRTPVANAALDRLADLLGGADPALPAAERERALTDARDQELLARVVERAPDPGCRERVLARVTDENLLFRLAIHAPDTASRLAAADRIVRPDTLRRLVREARDKKVAQQLRQRLRTLQEAERNERDARERVSALLEQLARHARRTPDALYGPQLAQLKQRWDEVATHADADQARAARDNITEAEAKVAAQREAEARAAAVREAEAERAQALAGLAALRDELQPEHWDDLNSLRALVATQQRRWDAAVEALAEAGAVSTTGDAAPPAPEDDRSREFARLAAFWQEALSLAQALAETDDDAVARDLLQRWPAALPRPARWATLDAVAPVPAAAAMADEAPRRERTDPELHKALIALRNSLQARQLKRSNRLWRKVEALIEKHGDAAAAARLEKLRPLRDELRDWHAFAANPHKEELCRRMEQLAGQDMPAEEKAGAIQALQDEWHGLMSGDREDDQALWDRFHAASEQAWEPCRAHFRELDALRARNLARREEIVTQLADFIAGLDWAHADWARIHEIRRQAPIDWKQCQPVAFRDSRDVGRRFGELLRTLDERIQAASDANRAQLEALVAQAEALDGDDPASGDQYKALQAAWKRVGWVLPGPYRGLHRRFRKAGDALFARRKAAHEARREAELAREDELTQVLEAFARCVGAPVEAFDGAEAERLLARAGEIAEGQRGMTQRLRDAAGALREARARHAGWQQWQALRERIGAAPDATVDDRQRRFAVAIELAADVPSPDADRALRRQYQLEVLQTALKGGEVQGRERILALFDEHEDLLRSGLDPAIRARLLQALA